MGSIWDGTIVDLRCRTNKEPISWIDPRLKDIIPLIPILNLWKAQLQKWEGGCAWVLLGLEQEQISNVKIFKPLACFSYLHDRMFARFSLFRHGVIHKKYTFLFWYLLTSLRKSRGAGEGPHSLPPSHDFAMQIC